MHLSLLAITNSSVSLLATTKAFVFFFVVCTLLPNTVPSLLLELKLLNYTFSYVYLSQIRFLLSFLIEVSYAVVVFTLSAS